MFGFQSFYFFFFIFLVFYVLILKSSTKNKRSFCIWCFVLLFLLSGFRGETVGGDLKRYLPEFYNVAHSSFAKVFDSGYHEPGYVIFIKLLSLISMDNRSFLLGTALAAMIGPFILTYKYSNNPVVSVLLYYAMGYYTNTFNNIRQSLALSVAFCIVPFLVNRKFWKYLIGVLIATSFHYSAIILLIVYPLITRDLSFKRIMVYLASGLVLVYLFTFDIFSYIVTFALNKYDPEELLEERGGQGYGLLFFYSILFLMLSLFYLIKRRYLDTEQRFFLSFMLVFMVLTTLIQMTAPIFSSMVRMTFYFFIPIVMIAVPYISSLIQVKWHRVLFYFSIFGYAILYMALVTYSFNVDSGSNAQGVIPYVLFNITLF